jgi:BlaI family penicillinase repressor
METEETSSVCGKAGCAMARLTKGEMEVMQVLWEHGSLKPTEIQERFPRPISNMALRSSLRVLMEKGHVKRRKEGRAYYYQARTARQQAMKETMRRMADVFAGGSPFALIAQIVKSEKLSEEHIQELQKIASETSEKTSRGNGGTK